MDFLEPLFFGKPQSLIAKAVAIRSEHYREGKSLPFQNEEDMLGYLATRMPATLAASKRAFEMAKGAFPLFFPRVLDIGCGPATLFFALKEFGLTPSSYFGVDRDPLSLAFAKKLCPEGVFSREMPKETFPLVCASYALNEMKDRRGALELMWEKSEEFVFLIEPGTPRGFEAILEARDFWLQKGGSIVAPCPHSLCCPKKAGKDWCHFRATVQRSAFHRRLKGGELAHEEEPFIFLLFSKKTINPPGDRIVSGVRRLKGVVTFELCTREGNLVQARHLRRDGKFEANWGDLFPS